MIRGFYTAASGIITQEKKLNTYSNNIANATTAGYKKDDLIAGTFGEHLAVRMGTYDRLNQKNEIGEGVYMQTIDSGYTVHSQGSLRSTERPFDLAVMGQGYFVIQDAAGRQFYTRDGQFALDEEGYLILPGFGRVQGEDGDIQLVAAASDDEFGTSNFFVTGNGTVYLNPEDPEDDPEEIDRILLAVPEENDYSTMEKAANGLFTATQGMRILDPDDDEDYINVMQGYLEGSNVDMSEEMTRIIASQRGLQSASQIVKMYDEMTQKSTENLGRIR